jgi:HPt (histidine-containing phosphotransfer) domain-containing protein
MILDSQTALERIEHDQELYEEICGMFREDVPALLNQLKEALKNGDLPTAIRSTHSLKSAAANIGADELCEAAGVTENRLRAEDMSDIHTLITEIDRNFLRVLQALG